MVGRAVLTTRLSSTTISKAMDTMTNVHMAFERCCAVMGAVIWSGVSKCSV